MKDQSSDIPPSNLSPANGTESEQGNFTLAHVKHQQTASADLRFLSWPQGLSFIDIANYAYDERGGDGVNIYVIENGIDPSNRVSYFESTFGPQFLAR